MSWHLNFGNDSYSLTGSIGDQLTGLFLCVETSTRIGRPLFDILCSIICPIFPTGVCTPCRFLSEFRILFYLQTPSSTIGNMPMKMIELVQRHDVDIF